MTTLSCSNFYFLQVIAHQFYMTLIAGRLGKLRISKNRRYELLFFDAMNCILYPAILNMIVLSSKCNNRFIALSAQVEKQIFTKYLILICQVNCLFLLCNRMLPTQLCLMLLALLGGVEMIRCCLNISWCCKFTTSYEFK